MVVLRPAKTTGGPTWSQQASEELLEAPGAKPVASEALG